MVEITSDIPVLALRCEPVLRDEVDVGRVDEDLAIGHADRENIGDVVVWNGVAIAIPFDESVETAEAMNHASTRSASRVGDTRPRSCVAA